MSEQELTYDKAFPGRFIKASTFDGKRVTLVIEKAFMEVLEGDKGKENKLIFAFEGKALQLVCNKTNAFCLKEMFGNKISAWVGKRVTFFPTEVPFGPKKVDAIRIYGSPDIAADIEVAARIGRKNFTMTLKKVALRNGPAKPPATVVVLDPAIEAAFGYLGWTADERSVYLRTNADLPPAEMIADLNARLDEQSLETA